jgi:hypothetical protein
MQGNPAKSVRATPQAVFPQLPPPCSGGRQKCPILLGEAAIYRKPEPANISITKQTHHAPTNSNQTTYAIGPACRAGTNAAQPDREKVPQAVFPQLLPPRSGRRQECPILLGEAAICRKPEPNQYLNYQTKPPRHNQLKSNHLHHRTARRAATNAAQPNPERVPKSGFPWDILGHWAQAKQVGHRSCLWSWLSRRQWMPCVSR